MTQLEFVDLISMPRSRLVYRGRWNVGHVVEVQHGCESHQFQRGVDDRWRYCWINIYGNVSGATPFDVVSEPELLHLLDGAIVAP